jgi:hypothetical protein
MKFYTLRVIGEVLPLKSLTLPTNFLQVSKNYLTNKLILSFKWIKIELNKFIKSRSIQNPD